MGFRGPGSWAPQGESWSSESRQNVAWPKRLSPKDPISLPKVSSPVAGTQLVLNTFANTGGAVSLFHLLKNEGVGFPARHPPCNKETLVRKQAYDPSTTRVLKRSYVFSVTEGQKVAVMRYAKKTPQDKPQDPTRDTQGGSPVTRELRRGEGRGGAGWARRTHTRAGPVWAGAWTLAGNHCVSLSKSLPLRVSVSLPKGGASHSARNSFVT